MGVLLQQQPPLAFGQTTPNTKLDPIIERVGSALGHDRTVPADHSRFSLRRPADEQFVGVSPTTARIRNPRVAGFGLAPDRSVCSSCHCRPLRVVMMSPSNPQRPLSEMMLTRSLGVLTDIANRARARFSLVIANAIS